MANNPITLYVSSGTLPSLDSTSRAISSSDNTGSVTLFSEPDTDFYIVIVSDTPVPQLASGSLTVSGIARQVLPTVTVPSWSPPATTGYYHTSPSFGAITTGGISPTESPLVDSQAIDDLYHASKKKEGN